MDRIDYRDPSELTNHPANIAIYGDRPDPDFVEKVRVHGVTTPIKILPDGTIIGGHRRRQAAIIVGLQDVPVIVMDLDEADTLLELAMDNEYRQETVEQRVKRAKLIEDSERIRAAERSKANLKKGDFPGGANLPTRENTEKNANCQNGQSRNPRAADKAAEAVGMGRRTYEKAKEVEEEIERAKAAGDNGKAEHLKRLMNEKSVNAAHKVVNVAPTPDPSNESIIRDRYDIDVPKKFREEHAMARTISLWVEKVNRALGEGKNYIGLKGTAFCELQDRIHEMRKLSHSILMGVYLTVCPKCNAKGCARCNHKGWLPRSEQQYVDADRKGNT